METPFVGLVSAPAAIALGSLRGGKLSPPFLSSWLEILFIPVESIPRRFDYQFLRLVPTV